jgi:hypothetical protein
MEKKSLFEQFMNMQRNSGWCVYRNNETFAQNESLEDAQQLLDLADQNGSSIISNGVYLRSLKDLQAEYDRYGWDDSELSNFNYWITSPGMDDFGVDDAKELLGFMMRMDNI